MDFNAILQSHGRIKPWLNPTPIVSSRLLNQWLGHEIYFKAECLQKTGAFKFRGALSVLTWLQQQNALPTQVVANSSGNHAQAVAHAAALFGCQASIYCAENISPVKAAATESYGAKVLKYPTRLEADKAVQQAAAEADTVWIPPYNHEQIIAGQGTACFEALSELDDVDAVFSPCGGGGLTSGTLISTRAMQPNAKMFACEPLAANDAAESLRKGSIQTLTSPPNTLADGAATPCVGDLTFPFLQQLDGLYEVSEARILYWTQWLQHLLKLHVEPTSAMTMEGVVEWLRDQPRKQRVLVILSGGNIDASKMRTLWDQDTLTKLPSL